MERMQRPRVARWAAAFLGLIVVVVGMERPALRAQGQVAGAAPSSIAELHRGGEYHGDVRQLPSRVPPDHERRPHDREEPSLTRSGGRDAAVQTMAPAAPAPPPGSGSGAGSFAGLDFASWGDGWPPDTNGDVGPTYYLQIVNTSVGMFNKADGTRVAAFSLDTLFGQGHFGNACDNSNFGDPVVVWDSAVDRWVLSDFAFALDALGNPIAPYYECFAVSKTNDPVSGGWNFYSLQTTDLFPDYPKLGVWPDGLYLTANMFSGNTFKNVRVWVLNKAQMYANAQASVVTFNLPSKVGGPQNPSAFTGIPSTYHVATGVPPAGRPNFIAQIWSAKAAHIWKVHVDWTNTANSTLTGPSSVTLASWGVAPSTVPAKNGNPLDTLYERLMVQNQYTNFGGTESLWLTHTVANPNNTTLASPRWYQLNVTAGNIAGSPVQQSTWAPDAATARWMPSVAVDKNGDMAIGYSASSSALFPAVRYAGRLASDPANTLGQTETSLIEGTASQCCNFSDGSTNIRWGDYSAMTLDPDGCTFWYTNEFYQSPQPNSLAADNWQTRIGSFKFASCTTNSGALQGTVTDSVTHNGIPGATVTVGASSTTTDPSGTYTLSGIAAGTYTATAAASGYTTGSASVTILAGVTTTQNFALVGNTAAATSLAVASASGTYGGTTSLSATLTSSGAGVNGKSVAFTLNGSAVGSALTNASGVASLSNISLAGINAGSYPTGVGASFAGDASYGASAGTNSLSIAQASQTITFGALANKTYGDPPFTVGATASSGLAVSFSASGNCTVSGTTVTITGAGSCTVTASQAGNTNYLAAANVPQSFNIAKASQSIAFGALAPKTYGDPPFAVSATATSGLAVTFGATGNCTVSATTVTVTGAGSCTVTASQAGNANYFAAADVPQTFSIAKANQTITFGPLPNKTTSDPPFTVSATASSGLAVSFGASGQCTVSGNTVTISGAGSCTVTASQGGNANYNAATPVPQTFTISSGATGPSASFVGFDPNTQGSWRSFYGVDGYNVINDSASYPSYAVVTPGPQPNYTWAASTSDVRALQKATNPADRIAATWYGDTLSIDVNLTDGVQHLVALYFLDYDSTSRIETVEVHDASSDALLDSRSVTGFHNGEYVLWNISGHVTIKVLKAAGVNAVLSGIFFGGNPPPPSTSAAAYVGTDTTTQGSWKGVYGADGYNIVNDSTNYPAYAQVVPSGEGSWTWAASTSDPRALLKAASASDRIAATWYGNSDTFTIDINLTDGLTHRVALYVVDWDSTTRIETVEVRDTTSNALLDSRTASSFNGGQYLVWNVSGHVTLRVTKVAGVNAVVSGLFLN